MTVVLDVQHLSKVYETRGSRLRAIDDVHFALHRGEFLSIVGPSGCGKTTLLRIISGLADATGGIVHFHGEQVSGPPDGLAVVFQDYSRSLMPWLSLEANVGLPLRGKGIPRAQRRSKVAEALQSVGLADFAGSFPWQVSGGMQQRAAIARALAASPDILLMDEPFASVDAQTRAELEDLVLDIHRNRGLTSLLITHDVDEAVYMGDRVMVLAPPPTRVAAVVPIDLPARRDQVETKRLERFAALRADVFAMVAGHNRP